MPTIVITGANGFLGSNLARYFLDKGWVVKALVHHSPSQPVENVQYYLFELGSETEASVFDNADCLVHCAYVKYTHGSDAYIRNVKGTEKVLSASRKAGIKKNIFISSLSAREDALSVYGKQKFECEKWFDKSNDVVIRPGLIIGQGGLFEQMNKYLHRKRWIPLISGGNQPMQLIGVNDVCDAVYSAIDKNLSGTYNIATNERFTYWEFYSILCSKLRIKPVFISIPYGLFIFMLSIMEAIGIKLPISRENLLGLKMLRHLDTVPDMKQIGLKMKSPAEVIGEFL
jgi:nucleoside-diphosphate-sugar epimerase